jgi:hypothetical protein
MPVMTEIGFFFVARAKIKGVVDNVNQPARTARGGDPSDGD